MKDASAPSDADTRDGGPSCLGASSIEQLVDLAKRRASGEFVCSCSNDEVHVYLQRGRIAWATDSKHRHAFTQHLKEQARLDDSSIEAVVTECRRSKRPMGETLVAWNLATPDEVRAAIRHQIMMALLFLRLGCGAPRALFLDRAHYQKYDPDLTFHLSELVPESTAPVRAVNRETSDPSAFRLEIESAPRSGAGCEIGTNPSEPPKEALVNSLEKLRDLQVLDGFSGAVVFTPTGEQLVMLEGDSHRLKEVGVLANNVLINSQKASLEMGAGRGQQVHVEGEKAHILARCLNEGTDPVKSQPGKAHIHLVLVLKNDSSLGLAKMRMNAAIQMLAADFRV